MSILYSFLFFTISWFLLMKIFNFSTYHKYFKIAVIPLMIYGVLVGFLLYKFNLDFYFIWYLLIAIVIFYNNYSRQKKSSSLDSLNHEEALKNFIDLSLNKTLRYYILSAVVFLISFSVSFVFFFNK